MKPGASDSVLNGREQQWRLFCNQRRYVLSGWEAIC